MPEGLPPFPLLLVLHVGRETEAERESWWFPAADSGVAVAPVGSPNERAPMPTRTGAGWTLS